MSSLAERQALLALLTEACDAGSRLGPACAQIGLSERTVQRWQRPVAGGIYCRWRRAWLVGLAPYPEDALERVHVQVRLGQQLLELGVLAFKFT